MSDPGSSLMAALGEQAAANPTPSGEPEAAPADEAQPEAAPSAPSSIEPTMPLPADAPATVAAVAQPIVTADSSIPIADVPDPGVPDRPAAHTPAPDAVPVAAGPPPPTAGQSVEDTFATLMGTEPVAATPEPAAAENGSGESAFAEMAGTVSAEHGTPVESMPVEQMPVVAAPGPHAADGAVSDASTPAVDAGLLDALAIAAETAPMVPVDALDHAPEAHASETQAPKILKADLNGFAAEAAQPNAVPADAISPETEELASSFHDLAGGIDGPGASMMEATRSLFGDPMAPAATQPETLAEPQAPAADAPAEPDLDDLPMDDLPDWVDVADAPEAFEVAAPAAAPVQPEPPATNEPTPVVEFAHAEPKPIADAAPLTTAPEDVAEAIPTESNQQMSELTNEVTMSEPTTDAEVAAIDPADPFPAAHTETEPVSGLDVNILRQEPPSAYKALQDLPPPPDLQVAELPTAAAPPSTVATAIVDHMMQTPGGAPLEVTTTPTPVEPAPATPAIDVPTADTFAPEVAVPNAPAAEATTVDAPVVQVPAAMPAVTQIPMADAPVVDAPAMEPPVDVPVADAPIIDMPAAQTPMHGLGTTHQEMPTVAADPFDVPIQRPETTDVPVVDVVTGAPIEPTTAATHTEAAPVETPAVETPAPEAAPGETPAVETPAPEAAPAETAPEETGPMDQDSPVDEVHDQVAEMAAEPTQASPDQEAVVTQLVASNDWGSRWEESAQGWVDAEGKAVWRPIVTTSDTLSAWTVETYLGVAAGDGLVPTGAELATDLPAARAKAIDAMVSEALVRGAHAIIGVEVSVYESDRGTVVSATGTAVTLRAKVA